MASLAKGRDLVRLRRRRCPPAAAAARNPQSRQAAVAARLAAEAFRGEAAKGGSEGRVRKQRSEAGRLQRRRRRTAQVSGAKLVHLESGGAGKGGMRTKRREAN